jgi:hypothetical protein
MKKILLGTSALVGAAMLAGPAAAQFTVTVGGYSEVQFGLFDLDDNRNVVGVSDEIDRGFRNDTEIQVNATAKADNGLTYGVIIQVETTTNNTASANNFDETRLFVRGSWGEIQLGDEDGASDVLAVYAPTVGIGQVDGAANDWQSDVAAALKVTDSSDATKVTYFTPVFSGFQAGISYAATATQGDDVVEALTVAQTSDWIELGANYRGTFSGVGVLVGAGFSSRQIEALNVVNAPDDATNWSLGLNLSYAGFTVGGGYVWGEEDVDFESAWSVGATYVNGPYAIGISYALTDYDRLARGAVVTAANEEHSILSVGGQYTIAPGLLLRGDWYSTEIDRKAAGAVDEDDNIFVLGVRVNF